MWIGKKFFDFSNHKYVMGILNVTPDSFYDGGRYWGDIGVIMKRVEEMVAEGVDIIDIGGESTRPGSDPVPLEEELKRVIPVIKEIRKNFPEIPLSIDTYKSVVAREALEAGADMINDISGGSFDKNIFKVSAEYDVPIVISHIKGTPKNMQKNPYYDDVIKEIKDWLRGRIEEALSMGVKQENIIIDPGIGFGKRPEDNLVIINKLEQFLELGFPILIGVSRKSIIGFILNKVPQERLTGTIVLNTIALLKGASIIRVHDVKEGKETCLVVEAVLKESLPQQLKL